MSYNPIGSPAGPFADAVLTVLAADAALTALVGGRIYASLKIGSRTALPYIVGEQAGVLPGSVPMQKEGGQGEIVLDTWSDLNGPDEVRRIQSRIRAVLNRDLVLTIPGYRMYGGSLQFEEETAFPEEDADMPEQGLFHGVQRVTADIEVA